MIDLMVNGRKTTVAVAPETPLLWVLREKLQITGTKYGCGVGVCGACSVLIDDKVERACQVTIGETKGKAVTTIEGIPEDHPVKQAWLKEEVSQCGYCQPGQIIAAVSLLKKTPRPTDADIDQAMDQQLCRCGTYQRIRKAIHTATGLPGKGAAK